MSASMPALRKRGVKLGRGMNQNREPVMPLRKMTHKEMKRRK